MRAEAGNAKSESKRKIIRNAAQPSDPRASRDARGAMRRGTLPREESAELVLAGEGRAHAPEIAGIPADASRARRREDPARHRKWSSEPRSKALTSKCLAEWRPGPCVPRSRASAAPPAILLRRTCRSQPAERPWRPKSTGKWR